MNTEKKAKDFHVTLLRTPIVSTAGAVSFSSAVPPIALGYLSAALRKAGYQVTNIDAIGEGIDRVRPVPGKPHMEFQGLSIEEIIERIPPETNLLGASCMFSSEWPFARDIIKAIKKKLPHLTIIAGGEHISAMPEFCLEQCEAIEVAVLGEGEEALIEIAECFKDKKSYSHLNGLVYRDQGKMVKTGPRKRIKQVDDIPWPAWDLLPLQVYLDSKSSHGPYRGRTIPILASRGCPYNCTFCSNQRMWGVSYISRLATDVVDEIDFYIKNYDIKCIEFFDLTTIIKKSWIIEFCNLLIERNIKVSWQITGGTRTEAIDEEVIAIAKKAGCEYLGFAPESGSPEVLKLIRKKVDLKRMVSLFKIARKYKLGTRANLIIGFPDETRKHIWRTLFFQMRLAFLGVLDAPIFEFSPYPGSDYFERLRANGVIDSLDDEYFDSLGMNMQLKNRKMYCESVGHFELSIYQFLGMSAFYGIYYLLRPRHFYQFIKSMFKDNISKSVFEQRITQNVKKRLAKWHVLKPNRAVEPENRSA